MILVEEYHESSLPPCPGVVFKDDQSPRPARMVNNPLHMGAPPRNSPENSGLSGGSVEYVVSVPARDSDQSENNFQIGEDRNPTLDVQGVMDSPLPGDCFQGVRSLLGHHADSKPVVSQILEMTVEVIVQREPGRHDIQDTFPGHGIPARIIDGFSRSCAPSPRSSRTSGSGVK